MNQAKRLFQKKNTLDLDRNNKQRPCHLKPSSFFSSKVNRNGVSECPSNPNNFNSQIGPGKYDISLPLVKPAFQTIDKGNNTIIVKFNNSVSPVFKSTSPRFKGINYEFNPQKEQFIEQRANQAFMKEHLNRNYRNYLYQLQNKQANKQQVNITIGRNQQFLLGKEMQQNQRRNGHHPSSKIIQNDLKMLQIKSDDQEEFSRYNKDSSSIQNQDVSRSSKSYSDQSQSYQNLEINGKLHQQSQNNSILQQTNDNTQIGTLLISQKIMDNNSFFENGKKYQTELKGNVVQHLKVLAGNNYRKKLMIGSTQVKQSNNKSLKRQEQKKYFIENTTSQNQPNHLHSQILQNSELLKGDKVSLLHSALDSKSERLHNFQPSMILDKKLHSVRYSQANKIRSTEWSKYKANRQSLNKSEQLKQCVPGPGSYKLKEIKANKHYKDIAGRNSWQFNSKTIRVLPDPLRDARNGKELIYGKLAQKTIEHKRLQHDISKYLHLEQDQKKKLYLGKKRSNSSLSHFHKKEQENPKQKLSLNRHLEIFQRDLNLNLTSIH